MVKENMGRDKVIVGEDAVFEQDMGLNGNILVCGSSGCGKTMSISEPRLLYTNDSSLVITLSKRRLVLEYAELFRKRGYHVVDLNFAKPECSPVAYDPLWMVNSWSDVSRLTRSIIMADARKGGSKADPYWDEAGASLLSAMMAYKLMTTEKGQCSMGEVVDFYHQLHITRGSDLIETSLDKYFERIRKKAPDSFCINCWDTFRSAPMRTAGSILTTLNASLDYIFTQEICEMMKRDDELCDFGELAEEKTVMFITTSPVNPALNAFVSVFYSQMFQKLFEIAEDEPNGRLKIPVHVLCDDFACGARIADFADHISIFREKGVSVTMNLQSESQLYSIYGERDGNTIINNSDTYVYMGGMDLGTANSISKRLNCPLDEVLYMPIGQEFVFRRGSRPIITQRYNILEDERYIAFQKELKTGTQQEER